MELPKQKSLMEDFQIRFVRVQRLTRHLNILKLFKPKVTKATNKIKFSSCVVKWTNKKFLLIHLIDNLSAL